MVDKIKYKERVLLIPKNRIGTPAEYLYISETENYWILERDYLQGIYRYLDKNKWNVELIEIGESRRKE